MQCTHIQIRKRLFLHGWKLNGNALRLPDSVHTLARSELCWLRIEPVSDGYSISVIDAMGDRGDAYVVRSVREFDYWYGRVIGGKVGWAR